MPPVYISSICLYSKNDAYSKFSSETAKSNCNDEGSSFSTFVKDWASTSRGESEIYSQFQSSILFPPIASLSGIGSKAIMTKEKLVLKRFVFSSASIEALKAKYVESSGLEYPVYPSRVVALLAFIWSRYVVATDQLKSKIERLHIILHAVNLRTRMDPPLSDYSFGNLFQVTITIASKETSREDWYGIVVKLRDAKEKLTRIT
nr:vinorine synthase-like [Quercus suber]